MRYLLVIGVLFIIGCSVDNNAIKTSQTNNDKIKVDFLFENDGCKVYRFRDNYYAHYYANCSPGVFGAVRRQSGKTGYTLDETVRTTN